MARPFLKQAGGEGVQVADLASRIAVLLFGLLLRQIQGLNIWIRIGHVRGTTFRGSA